MNPLQPTQFDTSKLNWLYIDSFGTISIVVQEKADGTYTKTPLNLVFQVSCFGGTWIGILMS